MDIKLFVTGGTFDKEYNELKKGVVSFIKSMDKKNYTHLNYPYKKGDIKDSLQFY